MPYRERITVRDPWVAFSIPAILWLILTVVAWPYVGWPLRIVLLFFLLVILSGVFICLRPSTTELVVNDGAISWGDSPGEIIDIESIQKIVLDEDRNMTFFELEGQQLLTKLPGVFNGQNLCNYIVKEYPLVIIESKSTTTR
jgi:hypothetical protein